MLPFKPIKIVISDVSWILFSFALVNYYLVIFFGHFHFDQVVVGFAKFTKKVELVKLVIYLSFNEFANSFYFFLLFCQFLIKW